MKFLNVLVSSAVLVGAAPVSEVLAGPPKPTIDTFFGKTLLPECVSTGKYSEVVFNNVTVPDCRESKECCQWMVEHCDDMVQLSKNWMSNERLQSLRKEIEENKSLQPIYMMLQDYEISTGYRSEYALIKREVRRITDLTTTRYDYAKKNNLVPKSFYKEIERIRSEEIRICGPNKLLDNPVNGMLVDKEKSWICFGGKTVHLSNFKENELIPKHLVQFIRTYIQDQQSSIDAMNYYYSKINDTIGQKQKINQQHHISVTGATKVNEEIIKQANNYRRGNVNDKNNKIDTSGED